MLPVQDRQYHKGRQRQPGQREKVGESEQPFGELGQPLGYETEG